MVGQVGAYPRAVRDHPDVVIAQVVGRADAGQHQQLRAVDGAAAQDDLGIRPGDVLSAALQIAHPDRVPALDEHRGGERIGLDRQIRPVLGRMQVGVRRRAAPAVLLGDLIEADPVLVRAVEVLVSRAAGVDRGLDEGRRGGRAEFRSMTLRGPAPP